MPCRGTGPSRPVSNSCTPPASHEGRPMADPTYGSRSPAVLASVMRRHASGLAACLSRSGLRPECWCQGRPARTASSSPADHLQQSLLVLAGVALLDVGHREVEKRGGRTASSTNLDRSPFLPPVRARKVRTVRSVLSGMDRFQRVIDPSLVSARICAYTPSTGRTRH